MKIAVLGANGMLGARVCEEFRRVGHEVTPFTRKDLDLRELSDMSKMVRIAENDWIVNCAGVVKSESEKDPVQTVLVNSAAPRLLSESTGARVLQISTDCVFDGKDGNYSEMDGVPRPVDLYGATKLAGEVWMNQAVTVRTSFIGWENGTQRGLLEWFVRQEHVVGYRKALWSGLSAREVARALIRLVEAPVRSELYHLSGAAVSKHDLLLVLSEALHLDIGIVPIDEPRIDRSLNSARFCRQFDYDPPTWEKMAEELACERPK